MFCTGHLAHIQRPNCTHAPPTIVPATNPPKHTTSHTSGTSPGIWVFALTAATSTTAPSTAAAATTTTTTTATSTTAPSTAAAAATTTSSFLAEDDKDSGCQSHSPMSHHRGAVLPPPPFPMSARPTQHIETALVEHFDVPATTTFGDDELDSRLDPRTWRTYDSSVRFPIESYQHYSGIGDNLLYGVNSISNIPSINLNSLNINANTAVIPINNTTAVTTTASTTASNIAAVFECEPETPVLSRVPSRRVFQGRRAPDHSGTNSPLQTTTTTTPTGTPRHSQSLASIGRSKSNLSNALRLEDDNDDGGTHLFAELASLRLARAS